MSYVDFKYQKETELTQDEIKERELILKSMERDRQGCIAEAEVEPQQIMGGIDQAEKNPEPQPPMNELISPHVLMSFRPALFGSSLCP